jgi:hypothetical protein
MIAGDFIPVGNPGLGPRIEKPAVIGVGGVASMHDIARDNGHVDSRNIIGYITHSDLVVDHFSTASRLNIRVRPHKKRIAGNTIGYFRFRKA